MKSIARVFSLLMFPLFVAVSCIGDMEEGEFELRVGDTLPDFTVLMNNGSTVTGASLRKGVSLVMFFHTSCPDCQNTLPSVQRIYDEFGEKIKFVLISREQPEDEISVFWNDKGYTMPYSAQNDRAVYNLFATSRVPRIYISLNGEIKCFYTDDPIATYSDLLEEFTTIKLAEKSL